MATLFDNYTFNGVPVSISTTAPTSPVMGSMVYDSQTHTFKVFDGTNWLNVTAEMMPNVYYRGMTEDERLCAENPGLADLKRQLDEAKEKYEAFKALVKE